MSTSTSLEIEGDVVEKIRRNFEHINRMKAYRLQDANVGAPCWHHGSRPGGWPWKK